MPHHENGIRGSAYSQYNQLHVIILFLGTQSRIEFPCAASLRNIATAIDVHDTRLATSYDFVMQQNNKTCYLAVMIVYFA